MTEGEAHRSLSQFSGRNYDKGRSRTVQALWFACQNLIFGKWWCPGRLRPVLLRLFGAEIGQGVFIRHRVRVLWPWKLSIGDDTWIGEDVWLLNLESIVLGNNVCLSQGAYLLTGSHDRHSATFEYDNGPIEVGNGAWIAARATVLRRVSIGSRATVGACALVTQDIPDDALVTR